MYDEQYTYAVARIRARETTLFSQATIDQLMACKDEAQCLQFLIDKGWGDMNMPVECRGNFDPGEGENLGIDAGTGRRHVGV